TWIPMQVGWEFKLLRYTLLSLLTGAVVWTFWRTRLPKTLATETLEFAIVLCLALLISPISWTHYYLLLLLPLGLCLGNSVSIPQGRLWLGLFVVSGLLVSLPVTLFQPDSPVLRSIVFRLLLSHYFLGGVLLLGLLLAARWHTTTALEASPANPLVHKNL
ncbi:hypothetical protein H6F43_07370, partial [Leptolyngbya sp. FACHB-36]